MNINHENSISRRAPLFFAQIPAVMNGCGRREESVRCAPACASSERVWSVSVFIYITQSGEQVHSTHNARSKTSSLSAAALEKSSVTLYIILTMQNALGSKTRYGQGIFKTQQPE
jgi:hypothetical protein